MSEPNVTLAEFAAMPPYRRAHVRKYCVDEKGDALPSDDTLGLRPEVEEWWKAINRRRVYFIQEGESGPIKIGVANDTAKRLATLQTGNSSELRLIGDVMGGSILEAKLHTKFEKHHVRGEWFSPHPDILAEIDRLASSEGE